MLKYQKILIKQRLWMCSVSNNYSFRERKPSAVSFLKHWLFAEFPTGAAQMKLVVWDESLHVTQSMRVRALHGNQGGIADR